MGQTIMEYGARTMHVIPMHYIQRHQHPLPSNTSCVGFRRYMETDPASHKTSCVSFEQSMSKYEHTHFTTSPECVREVNTEYGSRTAVGLNPLLQRALSAGMSGHTTTGMQCILIEHTNIRIHKSICEQAPHRKLAQQVVGATHIETPATVHTTRYR